MKRLYNKKDLFQIFIFLVILCVGYEMYQHRDKHIYLRTQVHSPEYYIDLASELEGHKGRVFVHLVGNGGNYEGALYIMNVLDKLNTTIVVDGSVYSAHAILALNGKNVILPKKGLFMLHLASGTNMEEILCLTASGLDRGQDAYSKCIINLKSMLEIYNAEAIKIYSKVLNEQEILKLKQGFEIFLSVDEIKERLSGKP